jgi:hypothetical protein
MREAKQQHDSMGAETAAYQAGHSKVSMTRKYYVEEYKETIDTRAVLSAFDAVISETEPPTPAKPTAEFKAETGE